MLRSALRLLTVMALLGGTTVAQEPKPKPKGEQLDRRDRREPSIVLNTGGRTGTCDVLKFTSDGTALMGAGDDKVVTIYKVNDRGLDNLDVRFLRWPSWREQRGSIFAMDISRDGKLVAVGGFGILNTMVGVLDRESGKVARLVNLEKGPHDNFYAVMAIAFSPSGQQLVVGTGNGSVWVWDLRAEPVLVAQHAPIPGTEFNRVRAVRFDGEDTIYSVSESGRVGRWNRAEKAWTLAIDLEPRTPVRAAAFAPGGWVAAGESDAAVRVASPDGSVRRLIGLGENEYPRSLAFTADGKRLAVGVGRLKVGRQFHMEMDDEVRLYDLAPEKPALVARFPQRGRADALAVRGTRLAVAGGDNQEVTLWDIDQKDKPLSTAAGIGRGLWAVAISDDRRYLAFSDQRNAAAEHPNRRGADSWRYFDLRRRRFEKSRPENSNFTQPIENFDGWTVRADASNASQWHLVTPGGKPLPLPLDVHTDGRPSCYTFLNGPAGSPPRLLVGHYWGFSLFELRNGVPQRVRLYTGHQGDVSSIAPSSDGTWVVTASPDQTIAAWSLDEWPSRSALGAQFAAEANAVRVTGVDAGSPAWEMGLLKDDQIVKLVVDVTSEVFDAQQNKGSPAAALAALEHPVPGKELFLFVNRAGADELVRTPTTVRHRPLWRFLPGPDREWVLWMWQGSYYDTSTNGDSLAGWLMNDPAILGTPRFFRLEQFRDAFQREDVIDDLLDRHQVANALVVALGQNPVPVNLGLKEPPTVTLESPAEIDDKPVTIHAVAKARGNNVDFLPQRVELWINDYRAHVWRPGGKELDDTIRIEPRMLRSGKNQLTLLSFNALGGRSEASQPIVNRNREQTRNLLAVGIGINDYSAAPAVQGKRKFGNLKGAVNDVKAESEQWLAQKGDFYKEATFVVKADKQATRAAILAELDRLAMAAEPNDRLLIFLSGHGDLHRTPMPQPKKPKENFFFCCPEYNPAKPDETGIDQHTLYEKLAAIRSRKVVFLDACHSGDATLGNLVRNLTPAGQGPIILAACDRSEYAYEDPKRNNGLFTLAILKALSKESFRDADANHDGELDAQELISAVRRYMPALLEKAGLADDLQNPQCFPRQPESFPLYRR